MILAETILFDPKVGFFAFAKGVWVDHLSYYNISFPWTPVPYGFEIEGYKVRFYYLQ